MITDTQLEIKQWFDTTYKRRGYGYLRPLQAYRIFAGLLNPVVGGKHLDVACGLGLMLKAMQETGMQVHGIDVSTEAVRRSKEYCPEAEVVEGNAEQLPYPDRMFDTITCIGSLERVINRDRALQEQLRVAKDDARFCFMVRNAENFTWKYVWKPLGLQNRAGHQDALCLREWKELFEKNGFRIEQILPDHWPYYRLLSTVQPWKKVDTRKVRQFPLQLSLAYEFIFVLRKS